MEVVMAADSWQAMRRAVSQRGGTVVEIELLGEFGEELEGEDGVSKIDKNEVLDEDGISEISKDEILVLADPR
ncbi:hypothetical protein PanWU01x14_331610 [Parasponia andersonii]|uniref:Uncharacterized protein n=1 Tax=Parasponia andersonii TaxID=3476 RepID=A0A2P5AHQ9_PARAD|nr:hypothetical protein PanWU01x14_331610 [Parasponia andersonii]